MKTFHWQTKLFTKCNLFLILLYKTKFLFKLHFSDWFATKQFVASLQKYFLQKMQKNMVPTYIIFQTLSLWNVLNNLRKSKIYLFLRYIFNIFISSLEEMFQKFPLIQIKNSSFYQNSFMNKCQPSK